MTRKEEFNWWYERCFCQSPSLCQLEYDDEKMWEAWQAGYKQGRDNAFARRDCPPEIFTIPKEKHVHSMNKETWTATIEEDAEGPFIAFPQEAIKELGWQDGYKVEWIDNGNGTWTIRKLEK